MLFNLCVLVLATPDARPYNRPPSAFGSKMWVAGGGHFSCLMKLYSRVFTSRLVKDKLGKDEEFEIKDMIAFLHFTPPEIHVQAHVLCVCTG